MSQLSCVSSELQGSLECGRLAGQTSRLLLRQRKLWMSQTSGRWSWRVIWLDTLGQSRYNFMSVQTTSTCCHNSVLKIPFALLADVCELWGDRFGHVFNRPLADCLEEWRKTVPPAQPGTFPKTRGEWRTVTWLLTSLTFTALKEHCDVSWLIHCNDCCLN